MIEKDFVIYCNEKITFTTNDVCDALQQYEQLQRMADDENKELRVSLFYRDLPVTNKQIANCSWC